MGMSSKTRETCERPAICFLFVWLAFQWVYGGIVHALRTHNEGFSHAILHNQLSNAKQQPLTFLDPFDRGLDNLKQQQNLSFFFLLIYNHTARIPHNTATTNGCKSKNIGLAMDQYVG